MNAPDGVNRTPTSAFDATLAAGRRPLSQLEPACPAAPEALQRATDAWVRAADACPTRPERAHALLAACHAVRALDAQTQGDASPPPLGEAAAEAIRTLLG